MGRIPRAAEEERRYIGMDELDELRATRGTGGEAAGEIGPVVTGVLSMLVLDLRKGNTFVNSCQSCLKLRRLLL